jgi:hypothetical protein
MSYSKLLAFAGALTIAQSASAELVIDVESLTTTSITLNISGTLSAGTIPGYTIPDTHAKWLSIECPGVEWIGNDGVHDISLTRSGMSPLSNASYVDDTTFASRGDSFGDFIRFTFYYDLEAGDSRGSGNSFTFTSATPIFDTSLDTDKLELYWGYFGELGQPFGVYQSGGVVVPEPSTWALAGGLGALAATFLVRRRRSQGGK